MRRLCLLLVLGGLCLSAVGAQASSDLTFARHVDGSVTLAWDANDQATNPTDGYLVEAGAVCGAWTTKVDVGSVTQYTFSAIDVSVVTCFAVRAYKDSSDGRLVSVDSATVTLDPLPPVPILPPTWSQQDIGAVGIPGVSSFDAGVFTIAGAGADVWGVADAFQFAYTSLSGDGSITARVASIAGTEAWVKAGVMIRNSADPSSSYGFMLVSASKGLAFQARPTDGAQSTNTPGPTGMGTTTAPYWVRLSRVGNLITAFQSPDGATWTSVGSGTVEMAPAVDVGLAVSSHTTAAVATATFDNVQVSAAPAPPLSDPRCAVLGDRHVSIFVTDWSATTGQPGSKARIDFQASSPNSPIATVNVRLGAAIAQAVTGDDLTALAGAWFTTPATAGAYPLSVEAVNAYGCRTVQATDALGRQMVVTVK